MNVPNFGMFPLRYCSVPLEGPTSQPLPASTNATAVGCTVNPIPRSLMALALRKSKNEDRSGAVTVRDAAALREVNPPTLVIWGGGDPYVPARYAQVQRQYFPRAEIAVLPTSGHWPFVDDPDGVANALVPFLRVQLSE